MSQRLRWLSLGLPAAVLLIWLLLALVAPLVAVYEPSEQNLELRLEGPMPGYPLGTDHLGRSEWSRIVHGARLTLGLSALITSASLFVGVVIGLASGYAGGWVDSALMRLVDLMLALPRLVLALAIAGTLGPSELNLALAITVVSWAGAARVFRSQVLSLREREFVTAARGLGASGLWIARRHILPQLAGTILVLGTVDLGAIVLSISGLSFLGLGAQPPLPEWGMMLNDARLFFTSAPQLTVIPGLAIVSVVLAANLLGDALVSRLNFGQRLI